LDSAHWIEEESIILVTDKFCVLTSVIINCNWVDTRWQWLFYMYTKYEIGYY
jgi:hypothetical protein